MRSLRVVVLTVAALLLSPCVTVSAQTWPSRTVTMLVPVPAGGTADLIARAIAQAMTEELGQTFVVENRPSGGGNLAAAAVARSEPDGLTLLFATQAQASFNKFMFKSLSYDPAHDFAPVVLVIKSPIGLVAGLDAPVTSFQAFIDTAKANPGKLTIGHAFIGSMAHVAAGLLQDKTGIRLTGVTYKGGAPMVTDLLGGHLPFVSDLVSNYIALAKDKKVRLLAVATARPVAGLPDVPTMQDTLHTPFEAAAWFMIMAPAGTPTGIVDKINAVTNRYLQSAKARDLLARQAIEAGGGTPAEAAAFVKSETAKWEPVIKAANITMD